MARMLMTGPFPKRYVPSARHLLSTVARAARQSFERATEAHAAPSLGKGVRRGALT